MDVLEELIRRVGGCAVLDGGLATQLESHGADINDSLWSALCLVYHPNLIRQVHTEYLEAGADIIVTSSYQATLPGFLSKGIPIEEGEALLKRSVELACEARDLFWENAQNEEIENRKYNKALVAASIGSYGAYLADGSEYSGYYGEDINLDKLKDFHRPRVQILAQAGPDLLAFETIPNKLEAKAIVELLEEEDVHIPAWITFCACDRSHVVSGEEFSECIREVEKSNKIVGVGINCSPPRIIEDLIHIARKETSKVIIVYPNSGEIYNAKTKDWMISDCFHDGHFENMVDIWHKAGAQVIGGCCRTTPTTKLAISKAVKHGRLMVKIVNNTLSS